MAGQRNPTALAEFNRLVDGVNKLETDFVSIAGQRNPTRPPGPTDVMISDDDFDLLEEKIKQLKDTVVRLAGQRNRT